NNQQRSLRCGLDDSNPSQQQERNIEADAGGAIRRLHEERINPTTMRYIPSSKTDRQEMLAAIGVDSIEQLFSGIPEKLRLRRMLNIPRALSEPELLEYFRNRAARNASDFVSFAGAGIYRHHSPIIIDALTSRS